MRCYELMSKTWKCLKSSKIEHKCRGLQQPVFYFILPFFDWKDYISINLLLKNQTKTHGHADLQTCAHMPSRAERDRTTFWSYEPFQLSSDTHSRTRYIWRTQIFVWYLNLKWSVPIFFEQTIIHSTIEYIREAHTVFQTG